MFGCKYSHTVELQQFEFLEQKRNNSAKMAGAAIISAEEMREIRTQLEAGKAKDAAVITKTDLDRMKN